MFALSACIETVSGPSSVVATVVPGGNPSEQLRQRIQDNCMAEAGDPLRLDDAKRRQCSCYAAAMVKAMRNEDLSYFAKYGIVPSVIFVDSERIKDRCAQSAGPRSASRAPDSVTRPKNPVPSK